jgi:hypothetical protein
MSVHARSWCGILTLVVDVCDPSTPLYKLLIIVMPHESNHVPTSSAVSVATLLQLTPRCIEQVGAHETERQDGWSVT